MTKRACGFVIFRRVHGMVEYLLMQTAYGEHHWTPPKGHVDPGESDMQTALRETKEEAGLENSDLRIFEHVKQELNYKVNNKPKTVVYWLAELMTEKPVKLSDEHQAFKWLPIGEACALSNFADMQDLLQKFNKCIVEELGYWYFRYTLVTELYMVEKWERIFINIFFVVLFMSFFVFNYKVLLPATQHFILS